MELNESFAELLVENGEKEGEKKEITEQEQEQEQEREREREQEQNHEYEHEQEHEQEQEQEQKQEKQQQVWKQEKGQEGEETADGGVEEVVVEEDSVDEETWAQLTKEKLEFVEEQEAEVKKRGEGEGEEGGTEQSLEHSGGAMVATQDDDTPEGGDAKYEERDKDDGADNNDLIDNYDDADRGCSKEEGVQTTLRTTRATLGGVVGHSEDSGEENYKQRVDDCDDPREGSIDALDALAAELVATALEADDTNSPIDPTDRRESADPIDCTHSSEPTDFTDPTSPTDQSDSVLDDLVAVLVAAALDAAIHEMQNGDKSMES
jgi:hypothetical protein